MKEQTSHSKMNVNHSIIMLLCCLIPLIITGILFYFGFKEYVILAVMLLCPVLHYFMMKNIRKKESTKENKKARCLNNLQKGGEIKMVQKLNAKAFGYSLAILSGLCMLLLGILGNLGLYLEPIKQMQGGHFFFSLSIMGIIAGIIEALIFGFILGWLIAYFYNKFA